MKRLRYRAIDRWGAYPAWLRALRGRSGVYVIRDKASGAILYVGESHTGRLYETLTRHFQSWSGPTSGPTYPRSKVTVAVRVTPPSSALACQDGLICRLRPEDNRVRRGCDIDDDEVPF